MLLDCGAHLAARPIVGLAVLGHGRFMDKPRSPEVEAFWESFRRARGVAQQDYDVCRMGSSPEMGDDLMALILKGPKRATACLLREVEQGGEMRARVGGHVVVLDRRDPP